MSDNFANPINAATRKIVATLMTDGRVRRAYIGIAGGPRPLPPRAQAELGLTSGVEVVEVIPDGPADRSGIRAEDLLIEVDGVPVADVNALQRLMVAELIGRRVPVKVVRASRIVRPGFVV